MAMPGREGEEEPEVSEEEAEEGRTVPEEDQACTA